MGAGLRSFVYSSSELQSVGRFDLYVLPISLFQQRQSAMRRGTSSSQVRSTPTPPCLFGLLFQRLRGSNRCRSADFVPEKVRAEGALKALAEEE